jgi:hypothetical protein
MRPSAQSRESPEGFCVRFILHQFIGVWGITLSAGVVSGLAFDILVLFGKTYPKGA